jgi:hypothetical protein
MTMTMNHLLNPLHHHSQRIDVTMCSVTPDKFGQLHPIENPELVAQQLEAFNDHVKALPESHKQALLQAQTKCPHLLTDNFHLMFLRSEVFNAEVSTTLAPFDGIYIYIYIYNLQCIHCSHPI